MSTAAIKAGRANVIIGTDNSALVRGLKRAQARVGQFAANVATVGKQFTAVGAAILAPLAAGVMQFANLESQLANVSTMLDRPAQHLAAYTAGLRAMSIQFGESTDTLSKGLYDVLSASIGPEKALKVVEVAARAAAAGMTDTGVAADAITTILNSYGLSAERAGDVSDLLFMIVKRGKTTFGQIAPVIGNVASIAKSAGLSLDEVGASLATMTRSGVQTDNAVTALNAIIGSFLKPGAEAAKTAQGLAKTAQGLGFEMSSATLQSEGLAGVFKRLEGMDPETIAKLFPNIRAIKGVLPVLGNAAAFGEDIAAMGNRAGATDAAFQKIAGTLSFLGKQIKQTGIVILGIVGEHLAPAVRMIGVLIKGAGDVVQQWVAAHPGFIRAAAVIGVALVTVGGALLGVAAIALAVKFVIIGLTAAVGALGTVLGIIASPAVVLTAVVAALLVPLARMWASSEQGQAVLGALGESIGNAVARIKEFGGALWNALSKGDWGAAKELVTAGLDLVWQSALDKVLDRWDAFRYAVTDIFGDLIQDLREMWAAFGDWLEDGIIATVKVFRPELGAGMADIARQERDARTQDFAAERAGREQSSQDAMLKANEEREKRIAKAAARYADALKVAADTAKEVATPEAIKADAPPPPPPPETTGATRALGTFSGAAARAFAGGFAFDRLAKASEQTAANTERTAEAIEDLAPLAFE